MIVIHLDKLVKIGNENHGYIGNNSLSWAASIFGNIDHIDPYLNRKFDRYELLDYCNDHKNDDYNCCVAIVSWGGMRRDHGRRLFENTLVLDKLIFKLRNGLYESRQEAFTDFKVHRINGQLPGLGIGYFTKFICFLAPQLNGYIMDQWASKSINLLTGQEIIKISAAGWVTDENNSHTYERYCSLIDVLAQQLNCTGFEAEKRIFSVGRGLGIWRRYLTVNYK